jgi:hypothetical protein
VFYLGLLTWCLYGYRERGIQISIQDNYLFYLERSILLIKEDEGTLEENFPKYETRLKRGLNVVQKLMLFPGLEKNNHTHRDAVLF